MAIHEFKPLDYWAYRHLFPWSPAYEGQQPPTEEEDHTHWKHRAYDGYAFTDAFICAFRDQSGILNEKCLPYWFAHKAGIDWERIRTVSGEPSAERSDVSGVYVVWVKR